MICSSWVKFIEYLYKNICRFYF